MNTGVIGDVHGNYSALKSVIDDMKENGIDSVIVLGDVIFCGTEPQRCFDTIKELDPIVWIKGNTDDWFNEIDEDFQPETEMEERILEEFIRVKAQVLEEIGKTMKVLREREEVKIKGRRILCVHGSDRKIDEPVGIMTSQRGIDELASRLNQDILLCAHTHLAYIAAVDDKVIMNVGSVGAPKDESRASYGVLRFDGDDFEYGIRRVKINSY